MLSIKVQGQALALLERPSAARSWCAYKRGWRHTWVMHGHKVLWAWLIYYHNQQREQHQRVYSHDWDLNEDVHESERPFQKT